MQIIFSKIHDLKFGSKKVVLNYGSYARGKKVWHEAGEGGGTWYWSVINKHGMQTVYSGLF